MVEKTQAIIIDIDGTVADHTGVRGHYEYDKVYLDRPKIEIMQLIDCLRFSYNGFVQPIFCSGREDRCRKLTEDWLKDNWFFADHSMFRPSRSFVDNLDKYVLMRKTGDRRPDDIIKAELYENFIEPHYNVLYVFDDRNRVVDMWRKKGLTCLQVADGNF